MKSSILLSVGVLALIARSAGAEDRPDGGPRRTGQATIPSAATEGPRDLPAATELFKKFVPAQPFGKNWSDLVKKDPPPKDTTGLAQAKTHPDLKHDPIEMQSQHYFEDTDTQTIYGFVSARAVRVYRYGKLIAVQIVLEKVGQPSQEKLDQDLAALGGAWKDPAAAFGLGGQKVTRDDLAERLAGKPKRVPLRIVFEPAGEPKK